ncbi:MAG: 2,3-bisphosphoglycerate-independent phosphoglycerate mutase [Saprospiraceae bacterium]|nr:2,3-bisphosphoglycerate-independent phosphoglycerate mutase [Saprospiraceae bacterium]
MKTRKKAALLILDGWGLGPKANADAIAQAETPFVDQLMKEYPHSTLVTHGQLVGLPDGQMGNSEVGHINIGAGRIVYQQFARINKAIEDGDLHRNPVLAIAVNRCLEHGKKIHLFGLVSDGGVHSHIDHLKALVDIVEDQGAQKVFIHAFLDGRDTDPNGGAEYLKDLLNFLDGKQTRLASVIGRYYAMDRDDRWERIKLAYDLMVHGKGELAEDLEFAVRQSYKSGTTDEFVKPLAQKKSDGSAIAIIEPGDLAICFNFRTDRPREISKVLTQEEMPEYEMHPVDIHYLTMTRYDETFQNIEVLFEKEDLVNTMGQVVAEAGRTQVRIAETEKYPHVTFFFSGGREEPFESEKRIMLPSPKVATYDLEPAMSAHQITDSIIDEINSNAPDFICLNYANTDMVGHTGVFSAAMEAAITVDHCLSRLVPVLLKNAYEILVIADHGNADYMINEDGSVNTAHTKNPVPCIWVGAGARDGNLNDGKLADLAPTLLTLMEIPIPKEMNGALLIST